MPAPKTPNPEPGAAARRAKARQRRLEAAAAELRTAGWLVMAPETLPSGRNTVTYTKTDQGIVPELP